MHEGKYTFITGASSGMGEATAKLLATSRNLLLCGRNQERLADVAAECEKLGADVVMFPYDLENAANVGADLTALLKEKNLPVASFIHFAGMVEVLPISRTKYSIGLKVMNVNYFSATEIISALLKKKVNARNLENIVLVSSIASEGGQPNTPHYCSSKGAINSLTMALATELAPDVRVNAISPGFFPTRLTETIFVKDSFDGRPSAHAIMQGYLKPLGVEEIAKCARFLSSSESAYITGQVIYVDGGQHMKL